VPEERRPAQPVAQRLATIPAKSGVRAGEAARGGRSSAGLLYLSADAADMHDMLETVDAPPNTPGDADLAPGSAALAYVNQSLR